MIGDGTQPIPKMLRFVVMAMSCVGALVCSLPAGAAGSPASAAAAPAADPLVSAATAIRLAQAGLAATSAEANRADGPIETAKQLDRANNTGRGARRAIATLATLLADNSLSDARRSAIVGEIARGGGVVTAADRLVERIKASPAERAEQTIASRTAPPVTARFWAAARASSPADLSRLGRFMALQADATWRGIATGAGWPGLLGLLAALLLLIPIRLRLRAAGQRLMLNHAPRNRSRRSAWALWRATLGIVIPWLAIFLVYEAFKAGAMVSAPWEPLAAGVIRGVAIAAAVSSVAAALLQRGQPSWRLLSVGDATAAELRPWTLAAAAAVFVTIVTDEIMAAAAVASASRDAVNLLETLLHTAVTIGLLLAVRRARVRADAEMDRADAVAGGRKGGDPRDGDGGRRGLVAVAVGATLAWLAVLATLAALLAGYIAFALLVSRMLVWLPLVGGGLYLAWLFVDDLTAEVVSGDSALGRSLHHAFGVRTSVIDQVGVALSALLRLMLLAIAAVAAFAPFGSNLSQLGMLADAVENGVTIGAFTIAPGAIVRGAVVLVAGLFVVRVVERWLVESYLPKTELDDGARNSIRTVARYLGLILAILWALAALGIGFERIALMLSALSVGIGFGLQAITQNFVSGLILLVERPVRIGDMVEVGGQKGDVKRINVRATEIETPDRSTLIVPNSELITKTVRNLTHADPLGVVQIKFTVPLDTDVDAVRKIVLSLFKEAKAVFDTPEPKAFIDSLDDGAVHFNCTATCASPRAAYATRSEVLFGLIMALRERGISIGSSAAAGAAGVGSAAAPGSTDLIGDGA